MNVIVDAYPLPRTNDFNHKIAQYRVFTNTDLKSAHH